MMLAGLFDTSAEELGPLDRPKTRLSFSVSKTKFSDQTKLYHADTPLYMMI